MDDLFGQALYDFYNHATDAPLLLHNEYGAPEEVPLSRFFSDKSDFPAIENYALQLMHGRILDVGAASGRHAHYLQQKGLQVYPLDISTKCCEVMRASGVQNVLRGDIFSFEHPHAFDTIGLLMNGFGIAQSIHNLPGLLDHLKKLLAPGGYIIADSSDISYLYEDTNLPQDKYFGELFYQYEYKGIKGSPFHWLYIDQERLKDVAAESGMTCQVIYEDDTDAYLVKMQKIC